MMFGNKKTTYPTNPKEATVVRLFLLACVPLAITLGGSQPTSLQKGEGAELKEPVTFEFARKSGPATGRKEAFDPKTQTYHLHVHDIARFSVKEVAGDLDKRKVVLHITGMLDGPEGPLTLHVPEAGGKNKEYRLFHKDHDKEFFRVERKDGVTTVEFLAKGKALLKAGTWFQYIDFYR
jgi:hypothetical protein